eukprot:5257_1
MATSMFLLLFIHAILSIFLCNADVHIGTNGVPWMCNIEPEKTQRIAPLSSSDQKLIHKLEQVQAIHRHGARTGTTPISAFLPNSDLEYTCNITTVETREYKEHNYYNNASKPIVHVRKVYVQDEQIIEGNCADGQSLQYLIPQHQANAHHIKQGYIGDESHHLFSTSTLNDIRNNLSLHSQDTRLSLTSTEFERTIASLTFLVSELLFDNTQSLEDVIINVNIHDHLHDPFNDHQCRTQKQYQQWTDRFNADTSAAADAVLQSQFAKDTIAAFTKEGGIWSSPGTGHELLYPYCAGMTLPLSNDTFWKAIQLSYDVDTAFVNTSYAKQQTECYYKFMNIPMLYSMQNNIKKLKKDSPPRLVLYSVHDTTLVRLLQSLGIYNHQMIIYAELITLEIYSAINDSDLYYFRLMRQGEFVAYPTCDYMNGETELCELDVLVERSFKSVVSYQEWLGQCSTLMTDCVCGYCEEIETTSEQDQQNTDDVKCGKSSDEGSNTSHSSFWVGIGLGSVIGVTLTVCVMMIVEKGSCIKRDNFVHREYFLNEESYKL